MKVSTRGRYAIQLMLELALQEGRNLSVKSVAESQGISEKYLEQVIPTLIRGGLILSDGDVEVNCAFETLVRLQRGELDRQVAKVLFD